MENKFSTFVINIRKKNNFTQEKFAKEILKISTRHLGRIEAGESLLTLNDFINIVVSFKLNESDFLYLFYDEDSNVNNYINKMYYLLQSSFLNNANISTIANNISDLHYITDKYEVNEYQKETLDMIECILLSYAENNNHYIQYFSKQNISYIQSNIKSQSILLAFLSTQEIVKLINRNTKLFHTSSIERKRDIYSFLSNSLGYLLEKGYKDYIFLEKLGLNLYNISIDNEYFGSLPIILFHLSLTYKKMNNIGKYECFKQDAIALATIYKNETLSNNIKNNL